MKYYCYEIEGLLYLPLEPWETDSFVLLNAIPESMVLCIKDMKGILAFKTNSNKNILLRNFIFSYQFLFPNSSPYWQVSQPGELKNFEIESENLDQLKEQIKRDYPSRETPLIEDLDFENIKSFYTQLPEHLSFRHFYKIFSSLYRSDEEFRNIIDLLLFTAQSCHKLYNNIFQKIAHLQTIFETLVGKPEEKRCEKCGKNNYAITWDEFIRKELPGLGVKEPEDHDLITKTKKILNRISRVKFIHAAAQLDINQMHLKEIISQTYNTEESNRELTKILSIPPETWTALNWENVFRFYINIVRLLIFKKYSLDLR